MLFLAACTDLTAYRKAVVSATGGPNGGQGAVVCAVGTNERASNPSDCMSSKDGTLPSLTMRRYVTDNQSHDYLLAFVEFDDQGWFWDRNQMNALVGHLVAQREPTAFFPPTNNGGLQPAASSAVPAQPPPGFLIITYAHGWRHNAKETDSNVKCFARLLERFDVVERKLSERFRRQPRKVVGVYIGWRGLSTEGLTPWELASFWERKSTAERVGHGGVTELLMTLNELRGRWNPSRDPTKTQLVITGHSFGGKVVYSALSQLLVRRSRQIPEGELCGGKKSAFDLKPATSIGDLIVLVNPAFEGALYEPLFQSAVNRCYPAWQRPISLIVTSQDDTATASSFPLGQRVGNLFEETRPDGEDLQWKSLINTVGHLDRYQTHKLEKITPRQEGATTLQVTKLTEFTNSVISKFKTPEIDQTLGKECQALGTTQAYENSFKTNNYEAELLKFFYKKSESRATPNTPCGETQKAENYRVSSMLAEDVVIYGAATKAGNLVLTRESEYSARYPYFVVRTDGSVIPDHNTFYTPDFANFMLRFFMQRIAEKIGPDVADDTACMATTAFPKGQCLVPGSMMCGVSCKGETTGKSCSALEPRKAAIPSERTAADR